MKTTGQLPAGKYKERILCSPHYRNGAFQNLSPTPMKPEGVSYWKMLRTFFRKHPDTAPASALPVVETDLDRLSDDAPVIVWFGHSSYLLRIRGKHLLVDPVFSGSAAPFSFMVKAFPGTNRYQAADMPVIDYLLLTHDHYDHLDYRTLLQLKKKIRSVYCSLGVGAHLRYWGFDPEMMTEMDWGQREELDADMELIAAPARHFSGRGWKRAQSLWSSFILRTPDHSIYIGGDSGYDTHFSRIGREWGPFDLAILEAGQYNVMWPLIHMMPEETVQAALDLQAKALMPVHWGKFRLSTHPWQEPVQRVLACADEAGLPVISPRIGEPVSLNGNYRFPEWWKGW